MPLSRDMFDDLVALGREGAGAPFVLFRVALLRGRSGISWCLPAGQLRRADDAWFLNQSGFFSLADSFTSATNGTLVTTNFKAWRVRHPLEQAFHLGQVDHQALVAAALSPRVEDEELRHPLVEVYQ